MATRVRFYEEQYPDIDDLVIAQVHSIQEMGVYVKLLEYGNVDAMILPSELSKRRIRSMSRVIRVGKQDVFVVLRVDKEKGYIDLSKRRVSPSDILRAEEKFNKSKAVHGIIMTLAGTLDRDPEMIYRAVAWPLYRRYGHAYDAFKRSIRDEETVFTGIEIDEELREALMTIIRRRLTPTPVKIRADVEVTCFAPEGIDTIRDALIAAEAVSTEEIQVECKIIAAPLYVFVTTTLDRETGTALVQSAIQTAQDHLEDHGGELNTKVPPRVVSDTSDSAPLEPRDDDEGEEEEEEEEESEDDV
eukprot:gnl/Trimastix_PCT/667.p1 GENE.gnl/Trimastix_PCT/667~~gnl/Trimastix_PCT/667.p1  ORF type:complete len:302 (+),score=124.59 gnl/Trimastix_PCT/667:127-1032(+)